MERTLPRELRAVLLIFNANSELQRKDLPYVNTDRQSIDWERILENDYGGGQAVALRWAWALWTDRMPKGSDPFNCAFAMDGWLRVKVYEALGVRWGLIE